MKAFGTKLLVIAVLFSMGATAVASGFRCISEDGYHLKIYNYLHAEDGTRLPAVFVLSNDEETLVVAKGEEIIKVNLSNVVQYAAQGSESFDVDWVIAQIRFKEGREKLRNGELAYGNLIFAKGKMREVSQMFCARYKKHP